MLTAFKQNYNTCNSTSKIKYIRYYQQFMEFLITDIDSPEYEEYVDPILKLGSVVDTKRVNHEIDTIVCNM